jgi:dTMP kinase
LRKDIFIAFEGIDGSGKSTAARIIGERLRELGLDVVSTREPGGTEPGRQIRALLLENDHALAPVTELLLMCADRAEHVATVIRPALEIGKIVLCDRYAGSTRAYQGYGLGLDTCDVDAAIAIATGGLMPDLTILFDLEPSAAHARRSGDAGSLNQLDMRDFAYRTRVRDGFLALAGSTSNWHVIDASQPAERVVDLALELINALVTGQQVAR